MRAVEVWKWYMQVVKAIPPITLRYKTITEVKEERVITGYRKTGQKRTKLIDSVTGDEIGSGAGVGSIVEIEYEEKEPIYETRIRRYDRLVLENREEVEQWYRNLTYEQKLALNCVYYYGTEKPNGEDDDYMNELMAKMQVIGGVEGGIYKITDEEVFIDEPIALAEIYMNEVIV